MTPKTLKEKNDQDYMEVEPSRELQESINYDLSNTTNNEIQMEFGSVPNNEDTKFEKDESNNSFPDTQINISSRSNFQQFSQRTNKFSEKTAKSP